MQPLTKTFLTRHSQSLISLLVQNIHRFSLYSVNCRSLRLVICKDLMPRIVAEQKFLWGPGIIFDRCRLPLASWLPILDCARISSDSEPWEDFAIKIIFISEHEVTFLSFKLRPFILNVFLHISGLISSKSSKFYRVFVDFLSFEPHEIYSWLSLINLVGRFGWFGRKWLWKF